MIKNIRNKEQLQEAALPFIIKVTEGRNFPQYADSYPSTGHIQTETNGTFHREVELADGSTGVYEGDCSPSGTRYMKTGQVEYRLSGGCYWPGL